MEEVKPATETSAPTIAPEEDTEARIAQIEAEKENYRKAYLKEVEKRKNGDGESDEERMRRVVQEELANSKLAEFDRQKDELLKKALKENKELKLAHLNKTGTPPAAMGAHSESAPVRDTLVTPEQMTYFKSLGWDDKKIEMYKKNLLRKR